MPLFGTLHDFVELWWRISAVRIAVPERLYVNSRLGFRPCWFRLPPWEISQPDDFHSGVVELEVLDQEIADHLGASQAQHAILVRIADFGGSGYNGQEEFVLFKEFSGLVECLFILEFRIIVGRIQRQYVMQIQPDVKAVCTQRDRRKREEFSLLTRTFFPPIGSGQKMDSFRQHL
jgi:hypothetical protein